MCETGIPSVFDALMLNATCTTTHTASVEIHVADLHDSGLQKLACCHCVQLEREAHLEMSREAAVQEEKAKQRAEEEDKEGCHDELLTRSAVEGNLSNKYEEEQDSDEELLDSSDEEEDSDEDLSASPDEEEDSPDEEEDSDGELLESSDEEDDIARWNSSDDEDRHEHGAACQFSGGDAKCDDDITVSGSFHIVTQ